MKYKYGNNNLIAHQMENKKEVTTTEIPPTNQLKTHSNNFHGLTQPS